MKENNLITISLMLCFLSYLILCFLITDQEKIKLFLALIGIAMLTYIGPWTSVFSIEGKRVAKSGGELASIYTFLSIGNEFLKFIDMIIVGSLMKSNLNSLFYVLSAMMLINILVSLARKYFLPFLRFKQKETIIIET